jgi:hypothetical protein
MIIQINPNKVAKSVTPSQSRPKSRSHSSMNFDQKLLKLRKDLPELKIGDEVLAKFPANGWYYRSSVKDYLGDYKYKINTGLNESVEVFREDIIKLNDKIHDSFEVKMKILLQSN